MQTTNEETFRPTTHRHENKATPASPPAPFTTARSPIPETGAVAAPIYATSTYVQQELGKHKGYEYARVSNPTRDRLEKNLAALEGGIAARVFASGMAAINAICTMFKSGDHVVCGTRSLRRRSAPVQSGAHRLSALNSPTSILLIRKMSSAPCAKIPAWFISKPRPIR